MLWAVFTVVVCRVALAHALLPSPPPPPPPPVVNSLIGFTANLNATDNYVAAVNPATGGVTTMGVVPTWDWEAAIYDRALHAFVGLAPNEYGDVGLVTMNATSGATEAYLPLRAPFSSGNMPLDLQLDRSTGDLYAFNLAVSDDDGGFPSGLYRIDRDTAATTLVASVRDCVATASLHVDALLIALEWRETEGQRRHVMLQGLRILADTRL